VTDAPQKHLPPINAETAPFWEACAAQRLALQQCRACASYQFYPRLICTRCGSRELDWRDVSGRGLVRSYTIVRRAVSAAYEPDVPYVVALVELAEGPVMMSNVVGCDPETVHSGMAVRVRFERWSDSVTVPLFEPASST
jgi:uncharacterized OB-fold protein